MELFTGFCGFQPKKKGTYVVDVIQDGAKFPGSPFQIQIGDTEVCSAAKVKVTGAAREGMTQQWNDVTINVEEAGEHISLARKFSPTYNFDICLHGCMN